MILICSNNDVVLQRWAEAVGSDSKRLDTDTILDESELPTQVSLAILHQEGLSNFSQQKLAGFIARNPKVKVMVLTDNPDDDIGIEFLRLGAVGYCNTYTAPELAKKAVEVVQLGDVWVGRKLIERLIADLAHSKQSESPENNQLAQLTERELEIANLVGDGASNKHIASKLDITERTVKAHLSAVFKKTGTRDRLQLALLVNESR